MRTSRDEQTWFRWLVRQWLQPIFHPTSPPDAVPAFSTDLWVDQIDAALNDLPQRHQGSFCQLWFSMDAAERIAWVERRKAALLIMWVRGGPNGLQGLGERLCKALADIDR